MTTFQTLLEEERTGSLISSEELYLNLAAKAQLAGDIPAMSSIFLSNNLGSHSRHDSPHREMSRPASEIVVKIDDVDIEADASTPASDMPDTTT
ncbi:hypothetical protein RRF57_000312 [Xylaria bambusicola]|uniref:Uncharacterized protein n=1 Tax=Xylaria bambusicola TaxID=326684 RepID=A0AAN7UCM5_9PEZI